MNTFLRDGAYVTDPVLVDSGATYTPGISERRGMTTTYLHSGLKNAFAQSGAAQTLAAVREYDAFGNVTSGTGAWAGPFGYAGKFGYQSPSIPGTSTPDEGLTLMGHRYYDPSTGRFLTRDPIFDGRNWYSYGGGEANPLTGADLTGLFSLDSVRTNWQTAVQSMRDLGWFTPEGIRNLSGACSLVQVIYRALQSHLNKLGIALTPHTFSRIAERFDISSFFQLLDRGSVWLTAGGRYIIFDPRSRMIAIFNQQGRLMTVVPSDSQQGQQIRAGAQRVAKDDFVSKILRQDYNTFRERLESMLHEITGEQ